MLPVLNLNTFIHDNGAQENLTMQKLDNVIKSWIIGSFGQLNPLSSCINVYAMCHTFFISNLGGLV